MSTLIAVAEVQEQTQDAVVTTLETLQDAELAMIGGGGVVPSCD